MTQATHASIRTPAARQASAKELTHERLGDRFIEAINDYDTQRRVETLVDEFFTDDMLRGRQVLDVGCGLGFFSERLAQRGAEVTATDIGPTLVQKTIDRVGCHGEVADAMTLVDQFGHNAFDVVVSSECIEHTPAPCEALKQMCGVLKPGGYLAVSTPNLPWLPVVRLATWLRLRPFDGYENFSTFGSVRRALRVSGVSIVRQRGLHLLPFQLKCYRFLRWADANLQLLRGAMINIAVLGRKEQSSTHG